VAFAINELKGGKSPASDMPDISKLIIRAPIDGMIVEANAGYKMEEDGTGRVLVQFGERCARSCRTSNEAQWRRMRSTCRLRFERRGMENRSMVLTITSIVLLIKNNTTRSSMRC